MRPGVAAPLHAVLLPSDQHQVLPQHLRPARPSLSSPPPAAVPLLRKHRRFSGSTRPSLQICEQLQSCIGHTSLHTSTEGLQERGGGGGGLCLAGDVHPEGLDAGHEAGPVHEVQRHAIQQAGVALPAGQADVQLVEVVLAPLRPGPLRRTAPISPSNCPGGPRSKKGACPGPAAAPSHSVTSRCYPLRLRSEAVATQHGAPARQLLTGGAADGTQVCGRGGGQGRGAGALE